MGRQLGSVSSFQTTKEVVPLTHELAKRIKQVLATYKDVGACEGIGVAVPGMPIGSPGMEVEGSAPETYDVVLFGNGKPKIFARYRGRDAI